jgi:hypothetical protein
LGELPADAQFDTEEALTSHPIAGRPFRRDLVGRLAVEVLLPTGPMWHYGLLGGTFDADDTSWFRGSVGYRSVDFTNDLPWSLSPARTDRLAVGLPLWAAQAVVGFLANGGRDLERLPSGLLSITHAVIGEAGSSTAILQAITLCLTAIVSEAPGLLTGDRLAELVSQCLQQGFVIRG